MDKKKNKRHVDIDIGNTSFLITMSKMFLSNEDGVGAGGVHSHAGFEVHVISEGEGLLESEEGSLALRKGDTLILPPGFIHQRLSVKKGIKTSFSFTLKKISGEKQADTYSHIEEILLGVKGPKILVGSKYSEYLERIFIEYYSKRYFSKERLRSLFRLLITDLVSDIELLLGNVQESDGSTQADSYTLISAVMEEYVTSRFNASPSLSELASIVHLGMRQTSRVFSQCFGASFSEYIKRRRLDSAKFLLCNTDKSFTAIALESGYRSYNGFYKLFKSSMGVSPDEYRKKHQENKQEDE